MKWKNTHNVFRTNTRSNLCSFKFPKFQSITQFRFSRNGLFIVQVAILVDVFTIFGKLALGFWLVCLPECAPSLSWWTCSRFLIGLFTWMCTIFILVNLLSVFDWFVYLNVHHLYLGSHSSVVFLYTATHLSQLDQSVPLYFILLITKLLWVFSWVYCTYLYIYV